MKTARTIRIAGNRAALFVTVATGAALLAGSAMAQMYEKPYGFAPRDRAGLAVYMKNLDESRKKQSTTTSDVGSATYLVCGGGGGSASSTANSSCIILNNSDAALGIGQDSIGDQGAESNTETNTTTADEVANILNQTTTTTTK